VAYFATSIPTAISCSRCSTRAELPKTFCVSPVISTNLFPYHHWSVRIPLVGSCLRPPPAFNRRTSQPLFAPPARIARNYAQRTRFLSDRAPSKTAPVDRTVDCGKLSIPARIAHRRTGETRWPGLGETISHKVGPDHLWKPKLVPIRNSDYTHLPKRGKLCYDRSIWSHLVNYVCPEVRTSRCVW